MVFAFRLFTLKSSIEWCEDKYTITNYIAEFWNTLSGFILIASSLFYYYNNKKWINESDFSTEFKAIRNLLFIVGCGTILFHGSLLYLFQLLDEIPMLLLTSEYIYILLTLKTTRESISLKTYNIILSILRNLNEYILLIICSYFINPKLQVFFFHLTFKVLEIILISIFYNLSKSLNKLVYHKITNNEMIFMIEELNIVQYKIKKYIDLRKKLKKCIKIGLFFYILSISLWVLEHNFCNYTRTFQLHALWHIFSSIGIYYLNNIIKYNIEINKF